MAFFTYDGEEPLQNCKRRFMDGSSCVGLAEKVGRYSVHIALKEADKYITG